MQWVWIILGLMLLMVAALLTLLLRRRQTESFCRIPFPRRMLRLLRKTAGLPTVSQDVLSLREHALRLMVQIDDLRRELLKAPPLPAASDGEPRLMELARDAADADHFTLDALLHAMSGWEQSATSLEVSAFPVCVGAAQCQRLALVLRTIRADARLRKRAEKLAFRLLRSKKPYVLLEKAGLNSLGLATLARALRQQEQPEALVLLERWLSVHDVTIDDLARQDDQRQLQLAEELRRAESCLEALASLPWLEHCEQADDLHTLLLTDPAGTYPRMDAASRLQLRRQLELLSRRTGTEAAVIIRQALLLCEDAEPRTMEHSLCWYLQDPEGLRALMRQLPSSKGRLYARYTARRGLLRYHLLWGLSIFAGFCFLQSGQPVFMLPFFMLTAGDIIRLAVNRIPETPLPRMSMTHQKIRTLVVMPALLRDQHDAVRMIRRLKTISHAFQDENAEYLLLGDFLPSMTAVSSTDGPIMEAASSAAAALADQLPLHYIQRGRAWDRDRHTYCARGGRRGAVSEICRLISQGECADVIACATIEPADLERHFDYILVLSPDKPCAPGTLHRLLETMTHPLCTRYPTAAGWRGYAVLSTSDSAVFDGAGLIQPDAYLEATDGLLFPQLDADALCGELAGYACIGGDRPTDAAFSRPPALDAVRRAWQLLPWQLSWVKTPGGVVNNPLNKEGRFHLREELRRMLPPLGQFGLLLWSVLTQNWLLFAFSLLLPEIRYFTPRRDFPLRALCRLVLLPVRALTPLLPLWDILRRKASPSELTPAVEVWAQGLCATLFAALGVLLGAFAVPALMLSAGFACFPLAHRFLDAPLQPEPPLTQDQLLLLEEAAAATWRYFSTHGDTSRMPLPPATVQYEPGPITADATSPEAIAAALLSCLCAKDLGYISPTGAASRIKQIILALRELPLPFGLPCQRYALPSGAVLDPRVSAASTGFLAAALMTTAQALRTWLPELPQAYVSLSALVEEQLSSMDLAALYDERSGYFCAHLDADGQPEGSIRTLTDDGLLLLIAACARKLVPSDCLSRLSSRRVRCGREEIPLSPHGAATEHLLAGLFLPIDEKEARSFVKEMQKHGQQGLWGQGRCHSWQFDLHLHYLPDAFGLADAALKPVQHAPVYAPYAAALALPFSQQDAANALAQFCRLGAKGPVGFCDAVDLTDGTALVGLHDTWHQGLILAAAAHLLADAPLQRYFCALPEVEACLPLLNHRAHAGTLPQIPTRIPASPLAESSPMTVASLQQPAPVHLLGTADFRLLADARGSLLLYDHDLPLNTAQHFYLRDEGRTYHLADPALPGETVFSNGAFRCGQVCGSLRCEILHQVDTLRRRALHVITLTNLSTRDRVIDLADCLLPASAPLNTFECAHPEPQRLTLRARGASHTLHHTMDASVQPLSVTVCTDTEVFLERGRTFSQPGLLEHAPQDHIVPSTAPCLSFRGRFAIGGRGQLTLWFTTSLLAHTAPVLTELPGLLRLAAMQDAAIDASAALRPSLRPCALMLLGPLKAADWQMSLQLHSAGDPLLPELLTCLDWLRLHGQQAALQIHGTTDVQQAAQTTISSALTEEHIRFAAPDDALLPFHLDSSRAFPEQLEAQYSTLSLPQDESRPPVPAALPQETLLHDGEYGGFDPDTLDYVLRLRPGQLPPVPWENLHQTRHFRQLTDESGLHAPFEESVQIRLEDGSLLSPWSLALPRSIRMRPGETDWEAWSDHLDLRLRALCLSGHHCGLRILHIHNAADAPLQMRIIVTARLTVSPLICMDGIVMTEDSALHRQSFLAGEGWQASEQFNTTGHREAVLTCDMLLPPGRSGKALWLAGYARHGEDVARALETLHTNSPSALLRKAQSAWTDPLSVLTFTTPESTLDLLLNRLLPAQSLLAEGICGVPALSYIAPREARRALLHRARQPMTRDECAHFLLHLADYIRITGDAALLTVYLPTLDAPLLPALQKQLLSVPLTHQQLPQGDDQARRCFLYALAAQVLHALSPDPEALDFSRRLLNAADTYLWQDGCYGPTLRLDVQSLACAAYGANPRTRQAITTCWTTLYDELHGLIRLHEPGDAAQLPGLPENGGMVTLEAVRCIRSLIKTARHEEAFELLRALNPLHHTDTPERQATFRCPPWQLHGGMWAAPMPAGRAVPGGEAAAALLYAVILEDVLGLQRTGDLLRLKPCVPADWEDFSLTLRMGASTWHISAERRIRTLTLDGETVTSGEIRLTDDGKVHQARFPLT